MKSMQLPSLDIIGVKHRTTNENNQAMEDIPRWWQEFTRDGVIARIPNKTAQEVYAIYTDYEGDHEGSYSFILGCPVSSLESIPEGLVGITIPAGEYAHIEASGPISQAVPQAWKSIWQDEKLGKKRSYTFDFERYGKGAMNPLDAKIDIFLSVNQ